MSSQAGIEFGATEMSFSGFLRRLLGISCAVCEAASVLRPSVKRVRCSNGELNFHLLHPPETIRSMFLNIREVKI